MYTWNAVDGEFRIDVNIGGLERTLILDTGFTTSECLVGLHVSSSTYSELRASGAVAHEYSCELRLADGRSEMSTVGQVSAKIFHDSHPIGPAVDTFVIDGGDFAEELVGTCFFHRLGSGTLTWDLAGQSITLDS